MNHIGHFMEITYTIAESADDLTGILALQKANLATGLSEEEIRSQGFVTVVHSFEILQALNEIEHHIVAKYNERIVAYLLAMTAASKSDIPVLIPMFDLFDNTVYRGKRIADYHYLVVGQVCVDKAFRGQGVLDQCYEVYKLYFKDKYDFAITEIAASNQRSLKAHKRIGFEVILEYVSPDNTAWCIVVWDWNRYQ